MQASQAIHGHVDLPVIEPILAVVVRSALNDVDAPA